jgi:glycosyltransferase involved in cell wall biosynthesis
MLVSIITPTYRDGSIDKTWDSVLNQTNKNFEWILVSDGGLDFDISILESAPGNIRLVYLYDNYGPSVARNVGIAVSKGDIITYLDMGDELNLNRIQHIIEIYEMYPNIEILFDSYNIIQNGTHFFNILDFHNKNINLGYEKGLVTVLKYQNITIPLGVSHKRKPFVEVGGFQPGIVCGEDGILWRRMCDKIDGRNIMFSDFNSGNYYVSQTGQSRSQRRFEMGGFAFNADDPMGSNGQSLDENWFKNFSSKGLYDGN